jgi:hypothetical protein
MTTPHVGNAPTPAAPATGACTLIDFRKEARRRAILAELAAGRFCPLCFLRRFIERYPLFFELPERSVFSPDDEIAEPVTLSASEGSRPRETGARPFIRRARLTRGGCAPPASGQPLRMIYPNRVGNIHHRAIDAGLRPSERDEARGCAPGDIYDFDGYLCASNDADTPQEGQP